MINPALIGCTTGLGIGLAGSKIYSKMTGKAAGAPASAAHILTNDKLDKQGKSDVVKEQLSEGLKDTVNVSKVVIGSAAAASLAAGNSKKVAGLLHKAKTNVGNILSKVTVDNKNLKEIVKNSNIYKKLNNLPTPAKAAIAVGAAALALVAPITSIVSARKAGYIEGKHEANTLAREFANEVNKIQAECVA